MELAILLSLLAALVVLIVWNKRRRAKVEAQPAPPPAAQPLTPEQIAELARQGEDWERFKAENGIKGP